MHNIREFGISGIEKRNLNDGVLFAIEDGFLMDSSKVDLKHGKMLPCVFLLDVLCSFRKSEKFAIMNRCFDCPHFKRFEREMDEEDERVMDEIDKIRKRLG